MAEEREPRRADAEERIRLAAARLGIPLSHDRVAALAARLARIAAALER